MLGELLSGPAGILKVKVSEHATLQSAGGAVRLNYSGSVPHPIQIIRGTGDSFYAVDTDCQHQHCVVDLYNPNAGVIECACHGSLYAIDGSLVGGPAERGLNTFASSFDGVDTLSVAIPGLQFSVTEIAVQSSGSTTRLRLKSDILAYSRYGVFFQKDLTDLPEFVPFAITPDGAANLTSAFTVTTPITIYVDAMTSSGFYTVALLAESFD